MSATATALDSLANLPILTPADSAAEPALLGQLRHFHLGDPRVPLSAPEEDYLPAFLAASRDNAQLRSDYPLYLHPPGSDGPLFEPLAGLLRQSLQALAPGEFQAQILKKNLPRLEQMLGHLLERAVTPLPAGELLLQAGETLQDELELSKARRDRLQSDLDKLFAAVPPTGRLLSYGRHATLHLLLHAIRCRRLPRYQAFAAEIQRLLQQLHSLLALERRKSTAGQTPESLTASLGATGSCFLDASALSELLGQPRGSRPLTPERLARIQRIVPILEAARRGPPRLATVIHTDAIPAPWLHGEPDCLTLADADPCGRASAEFTRQADELATLFRAVRIARLEVASQYQPEQHDPWFATFGWEAFTPEELDLLPPVVVVAFADPLAGDQLSAFSRLLRAGQPVQILLEVRPGANHGAAPGTDPLASYRLELGYFAISHRQALVQQSSPARPAHLLEGLLAALDSHATGLHLLTTGVFQDQVPAWLAAWSALESRAHPLFRFDPQAGSHWAERLSFAGNPQANADWSRFEFRYQDWQGNEQAMVLAFTFADFALLEPPLRDHFRVIPNSVEAPVLIPLAEYLVESLAQIANRLPFVWAVDGNGFLHRLLVSRTLVLACRDRQDYWRTLQELAGLPRTAAAVAAVTTPAMATPVADQQAQWQAEQQAALEQMRQTVLAELSQRLQEVLGQLPAIAPLPELPVAAAAPVAAPVAVAAVAPAAVPGERLAPPAAVAVTAEPWVDTPRCTSCNVCIELNPRLFVYNDNAQAMIGDPHAGTYAQLVKAARSCPARCIHPGKPLNPQEPDLDILVQRAAAYN